MGHSGWLLAAGLKVTNTVTILVIAFTVHRPIVPKQPGSSSDLIHGALPCPLSVKGDSYLGDLPSLPRWCHLPKSITHIHSTEKGLQWLPPWQDQFLLRVLCVHEKVVHSLIGHRPPYMHHISHSPGTLFNSSVLSEILIASL